MTAGPIQRSAPTDHVLPAAAPRRRRQLLMVAAAVLLILLAPVGWSLGRAITAPGTDSISARVAEWVRDHHGSGLVTWLERLTYTPPKVGGRPAANSPLVTQQTTSPGVPPHRPVPPVAAAALPPVVPPASPPLPGEGEWHVLVTVRGRPAIQAAYVRPDATHTSYTAGIVRVDQSLVRAAFHPGTYQPGGGPWPTPPDLRGADRTGLLAAFNSAFRLRDARGGFYDDGRTVSPLRVGAASLVVLRDGRVTVGAWGSDLTMSPAVAVVRQNLLPIVVDGRPATGLDSNVRGQWGYTVGNAMYVWRSGIGVTRSGALLYVAGNRLSAATLADLLARAGAVRAMELDINPKWTSFVLYRAPNGAVIERNLLPDMQGSPRRYDVSSTRDFVALYPR